MKKNLISALLKYASYQYKEPKENILSGAFAFILGEIPLCRKHFVKFVLAKYKEQYPKEVFHGVRPAALEVDTQCVHSRLHHGASTEAAARDIVDIELARGREFGIFVECKFYAGLGPRQDIRYYSLLRRKHHRGILVFLSPSADLAISDSIKAVQVSWREIYELFDGVHGGSSSVVEKYLLTEFLGYLKENNMAAFPGLKRADALSSWDNYHSSIQRYEALFSVLRGHLEKRGYEVGTLDKNVRYAEVHYKITPEDVKASRRRFKKWKKTYKHIECGIYLYSKEFYGADFDKDYPEGLYPYVQVWSTKPVKALQKGSRILARNQFEVDHEGREAINDARELRKIVNFSARPKMQEAQFVNFFIKSIRALERAGVVRALCRM